MFTDQPIELFTEPVHEDVIRRSQGYVEELNNSLMTRIRQGKLVVNDRLCSEVPTSTEPHIRNKRASSLQEKVLRRSLKEKRVLEDRLKELNVVISDIRCSSRK